jgi:hypothetical protein
MPYTSDTRHLAMAWGRCTHVNRSAMGGRAARRDARSSDMALSGGGRSHAGGLFDAVQAGCYLVVVRGIWVGESMV